jgi:hypothetical protein
MRDGYIFINGERYVVKFLQKGEYSGDYNGYDFRVYSGNKYVNTLLITISRTTLAVWGNHTSLSVKEAGGIQTLSERAIMAVLGALDLKVDKTLFDSFNERYPHDGVRVEIMSWNEEDMPRQGVKRLRGFDSPEVFVQHYLFGDDPASEAIRDVIIAKIYDWERESFGLPYSTRDIVHETFLSRTIVMRQVDYLVGRSYIITSRAGDDELNLRLLPNGVDYAEALSSGKSPTLATEANTDSVRLHSGIYGALQQLNPDLGTGYQQVISDLNDDARQSWKGTANELREVFRGTIGLLAPTKDVEAQVNYRPEQGRDGPTQKQRIEYILKRNGAGSKATDIARDETFDERLGQFARKFYERASNDTHASTARKELLKLFAYFEAVMRDVLDVE